MAEEIIPRIMAVRMNETKFWSEKFRKEHHIKEIWTLYIYDERWHVRCCSLTPSYELMFIENQVEYDDSTAEMSEEVLDALREKAEDEVRSAEGNGDHNPYYDVRSLDKIPEVLYKERSWNKVQRFCVMEPEECEKQELDHEAAMEACCEHARCNSI